MIVRGRRRVVEAGAARRQAGREAAVHGHLHVDVVAHVVDGGVAQQTGVGWMGEKRQAHL